jgi:hypothetical protein
MIDDERMGETSVEVNPPSLSPPLMERALQLNMTVIFVGDNWGEHSCHLQR